MTDVDLAIIGAGPAGCAAAAEAAARGLSVLLVDEQPEAGGQIYRGGFARASRLAAVLGDNYRRRELLLGGLRNARIDYRPRSTLVMASGPDDLMMQGPDEKLYRVRVRHLLLATGAQERPWAFPGWTLPGVMGLGAAQLLLKSSGLVPDGPVVIAGSGPLVYLAALQLHRAGADIVTVLDTTPRDNYRRAVALLPAAMAGWRQLAKGLSMIAALRRSGVPVRHAEALTAEGDGRLAFVRSGRMTMAARHLLVHQGVIPQMQAFRALGIAESYDDIQKAWRPEVDPQGCSPVEWLSIAGDGAGIVGADAAEAAGSLAALDAVRRLGRIADAEFENRAAPLRQSLARNAMLRRFLDTLYAPADWTMVPDAGDTVVCRCEEVTVSDLQQAAVLGARGLNQAKAYTRCGMGRCQGRICGPLAAQVLSSVLDCPVSVIAPTRPRFPLKPVTVGALAELKD